MVETVLENNETLTDEQVDQITKDLDDFTKGTDLENIANLPSNNGIEEREVSESDEKGEAAKVKVIIDPNTGENKIIGRVDDDVTDDETFEEMCERIQKEDIKLDTTPITDEEIIEYISTTKGDNSLLTDIAQETNLSDDAIRELLVVVNKKLNNEKFNVYKAFPQEIRDMVDRYLMQSHMNGNSNEEKAFRNMLCESLIDEFISNISLNRITTDFNKEVETIFAKGSEEIVESVIGYTEERNKAYREAAEKIEDPIKKEKVVSILNRIDEAYNLTELKEFAKKCKVKKIELEKPDRIFEGFLLKYKDSQYNIYDIKMARPILFRNINTNLDNPEYTQKDIDSFFVVFCKQCLNMRSDIPLDHAYMYYVVYNIVLMDINKSENTKAVSEGFIENVKEVIENIRQRNK
jgi:hypothetical protein